MSEIPKSPPKPPTKAVLLRYLAVAKEVGADEVLVTSDGSTRFILKGPDGKPSALDAWKARREAR